MKIKHSLAISALITAVILNCLGLVSMRLFASQVDTITALIIGYLITATPLFSSKLSGRPILPVEIRDRFLIPLWGTALASVYALFILFPKLVTPSQVILGLTLAPLLATFLSGDLSLKSAFSQHKLKIAPIALLVALGFIEADGRSNQSIWTFFLILALFCISQTATRKLSASPVPFYAQSRMAVIASFALVFLKIFIGLTPISLATIAFGFIFGALLSTVFRFVLLGIRNTSAIESALLLSFNVPVSLLAEWIILGRNISRLQITLASAYVICVLIIQSRTQVNKQA